MGKKSQKMDKYFESFLLKVPLKWPFNRYNIIRIYLKCILKPLNSLFLSFKLRIKYVVHPPFHNNRWFLFQGRMQDGRCFCYKPSEYQPSCLCPYFENIYIILERREYEMPALQYYV